MWSSLICIVDIFGGEVGGDICGEIYAGRPGDCFCPELWWWRWFTRDDAKGPLFETFDGIGPLLVTVERYHGAAGDIKGPE